MVPSGSSSVLTPGFRPPSVPLVVSNPYLRYMSLYLATSAREGAAVFFWRMLQVTYISSYCSTARVVSCNEHESVEMVSMHVHSVYGVCVCERECVWCVYE